MAFTICSEKQSKCQLERSDEKKKVSDQNLFLTKKWGIQLNVMEITNLN